MSGRQRWPPPGWALLAGAVVAGAGHVSVAAVIGSELVTAPVAMVALGTLARWGDRRWAVALALATALAVAGVETGDEPSESFWGELVAESGLMLLAVAVGDGIRLRAQRLDERVRREAEVRVQAERLRIARDLHDVVAHGLSTIAVQSGVAAHLLDTDPARARRALDVINTTGTTALDELRSMVGVLRAPESAPVVPAPVAPDDLRHVLGSARAAGLDLTVEQHGTFPPDASDATVLALHRIVQEALTNVVRHAGSVPTTVDIVHRCDAVDVEIVNAAGHGSRRPPEVASTGVGIIGMTERARAVGGHLRAGPRDDGSWAVAATLRHHPDPS